ncbi:epsin-1 [Alosa alosa]|nr:epsin-1 [Alosa alosa]
MTHSMLRRTLKNLVQNFSEAEVKVREATSNDPWGPSSSQMSDISDLTYNVVACNEITSMLFKRLNDVAKNWRHVYKSVVLLEYLLKTGADGVVTASQENVHVVKALTEFRAVDKDGKDQGATIREKAKIVLVLIEDPEKLKEEREMAMKHKDKLQKATTAATEAAAEKEKPVIAPYTGLPKLDNIPSVAELMAEMAAKKEERRKEEEKKKAEERRAKEGDTEPDLWEQGATTAPPSGSDPWGAPSKPPKDDGSAKNDPWGGASEPAAASKDPWGGGSEAAPSEEAPAANDPWGGGADSAPKEIAPASNDPWGGAGDAPSEDAPASNDPWGGGSDTAPKKSPPTTNDPWGSSVDAPSKDTPASDDPWGGGSDFAPKESPPPSNDPWGAAGDAPSKDAPATNDPFGGGSDIAPKLSPPVSNDPWGISGDVPSTEAPVVNDPWDRGASDTTKDSAPVSNDPWGDSGITVDAPSKDTPATSDPFGGGSDIVPNDSPPASSDPWGASLDALVESPPAKSDPWETPAAKTSPDAAPASSDPWGVPTEVQEPKPDPFNTPLESQEPKLDPWDAPAEAPETKSDPWDAPVEAPVTKPDPWDAPAEAPQTKADAWGGVGDGASALSPGDPFGDGKKADSDPWGAPATSPPSGNDPWGAPPAAATSPSGDPFGGGGSTDAWGTPTKSANNGNLTEGAKTKAPQGLSAWLDGLSLDLTMPSKEGVNQTTPVAHSPFGFNPVTPKRFQPLSTRLAGASSYTPLVPQGVPRHHLTPMGGFHASSPIWGAGMVAPIRQGVPYGGSPSGMAGSPMPSGMRMPVPPPQPPCGGGVGMFVTGANTNNPFLI